MPIGYWLIISILLIPLLEFISFIFMDPKNSYSLKGFYSFRLVDFKHHRSTLKYNLVDSNVATLCTFDYIISVDYALNLGNSFDQLIALSDTCIWDLIKDPFISHTHINRGVIQDSLGSNKTFWAHNWNFFFFLVFSFRLFLFLDFSIIFLLLFPHFPF